MLRKHLAAEAIGTFFLLATVVGSGIMAENLSGGNVAIALLCNTIPTGAILFVLITMFGPIANAHFNPAVSLVFWLRREMTGYEALLHVLMQVIFGIAGVVIANLMFDLPAYEWSLKARQGFGQWLGEFVATFGLVATILAVLHTKKEAIPAAVGLYITAAYWFTSSTSFANPAVTIARGFSNTFAGIAPVDAPAFIGMQLLGAVSAWAVMTWVLRD